MPQLENLGEQPALSWGTPHGTTVFFSWTWQPMLIPSFFFSCLSTGLLLSSIGSWMSRTRRFGPVRWIRVMPQENRPRHACLALQPSCTAPASSAQNVQSHQVCGKIACLPWAEHQHGCHRTQKAGHFSPRRVSAHHLPTMRLLFTPHSPPIHLHCGKIKLWIGCSQGMLKSNMEMDCRTVVFFLAGLNSQLQLQARSSNHFRDWNSSRQCRA